jgi:hypothetical protein
MKIVSNARTSVKSIMKRLSSIASKKGYIFAKSVSNITRNISGKQILLRTIWLHSLILGGS